MTGRVGRKAALTAVAGRAAATAPRHPGLARFSAWVAAQAAGLVRLSPGRRLAAAWQDSEVGGGQTEAR